MLSHFPTATIHNIDRNAQALQQGRSLAQRLGYASRMTFACEDAGDSSTIKDEEGNVTCWSGFDVVFLAALVGMTSDEKMQILRGLVERMRSGCLVVCRSARGMRGVLYPVSSSDDADFAEGLEDQIRLTYQQVLELSDELMRMGYEILAEVHPWTSVVNSIVVLRVR
jgi:nicotianamine synthase